MGLAKIKTLSHKGSKQAIKIEPVINAVLPPIGNPLKSY